MNLLGENARASIPNISRALAYTPQPGDKVILECDADISEAETERLVKTAEALFGTEIKVILLNGIRLGGIVE